MTLAISVDHREVKGTEFEVRGTFTFDSSYPAGGESYGSIEKLGLSNIDELYLEPQDGFTFEHDASNKKIKVLRGGDQVARFHYDALSPAAAIVKRWIAPFAGDITLVKFIMGEAGSAAGPSEIDVNKGVAGTSIFTTEPSIANDDANGSEDNGVINAAADDFVEGDIIELEIDAVTTDGANMMVDIELTSEEGEVRATTDLSALTSVKYVAKGQI